MKAIGYQRSLPVEDPNALQDIELETPVATVHDLLVETRYSHRHFEMVGFPNLPRSYRCKTVVQKNML